MRPTFWRFLRCFLIQRLINVSLLGTFQNDASVTSAASCLFLWTTWESAHLLYNSSRLDCPESSVTWSSPSTIIPSLLRSWWWNMSLMMPSASIPGRRRPLPSLTWSMMKEENCTQGRRRIQNKYCSQSGKKPDLGWRLPPLPEGPFYRRRGPWQETGGPDRRPATRTCSPQGRPSAASPAPAQRKARRCQGLRQLHKQNRQDMGCVSISWLLHCLLLANLGSDIFMASSAICRVFFFIIIFLNIQSGIFK